eukprot:4008556-Prymnesium_polylepis.1
MGRVLVVQGDGHGADGYPASEHYPSYREAWWGRGPAIRSRLVCPALDHGCQTAAAHTATLRMGWLAAGGVARHVSYIMW